METINWCFFSIGQIALCENPSCSLPHSNRMVQMGLYIQYHLVCLKKTAGTGDIPWYPDIPTSNLILVFPSKKMCDFQLQSTQRSDVEAYKPIDCRFFLGVKHRGSGLRPSRICHADSLGPFQCSGEGFGVRNHAVWRVWARRFSGAKKKSPRVVIVLYTVGLLKSILRNPYQG